MGVPPLILDGIRLLLALAAPASLVALVLAAIALRREGTTTFSVGGGGFSKWMFWAIVMITLPQVFGWFAFWGVGSPLPGGGIGNGWMAAFANDAVIFVNTFVIGRLVPVLAAWLVLRSVIDFSEGYTPLASILGAMFLLAIPATAALLKGWNDGTRFGTASVIEGAWTYTASRIMPIAAGRPHLHAVGGLSVPHGFRDLAGDRNVRDAGGMERPGSRLDHVAREAARTWRRRDQVRTRDAPQPLMVAAEASRRSGCAPAEGPSTSLAASPALIGDGPGGPGYR